jgi:hypothetical protein
MDSAGIPLKFEPPESGESGLADMFGLVESSGVPESGGMHFVWNWTLTKVQPESTRPFLGHFACNFRKILVKVQWIPLKLQPDLWESVKYLHHLVHTNVLFNPVLRYLYFMHNVLYCNISKGNIFIIHSQEVPLSSKEKKHKNFCFVKHFLDLT